MSVNFSIGQKYKYAATNSHIQAHIMLVDLANFFAVSEILSFVFMNNAMITQSPRHNNATPQNLGSQRSTAAKPPAPISSSTIPDANFFFILISFLINNTFHETNIVICSQNDVFRVFFFCLVVYCCDTSSYARAFVERKVFLLQFYLFLMIKNQFFSSELANKNQKYTECIAV